ncbi:amino acid ABC transporter substrate-binding protein [Planococcus glaciei]|uniref:Transporter substrate-binding domain-containing protein n=1 Tax=Planococcus glaciei TaxID=459472 RepID=A0A7H8Q5F0_9BACL|nr:transporter substrate-binding domain-containing protein [Planococcus glaciei]ETP68638.1 ABC transporter substrate-binding protein [Planococcus glaciei CHR43]KOF10362.1 amino acid ABC transporter substrate-binding protein [Planococcus glaciei]MBX0313708.1 transporter substrate-binding domain-containing protein [Planococcus glaciei]QDY44548.1 transporter substrate-binding domain-containing protein [Planococcus glaciei]QKX49147.1 transporter substrate-binding domain-containing protein [Planoco
MMTVSNKPKWLLAMGAASMILLAGCGNSSETAEPAETKTAWDEIQEQGSMTVATSGTLLATSFRDSESDELTGFEVEVVRELGKRLDLDIEFKELGFDEMLTSVNTGQIDIAANDIEITEDRLDNFIFSTPIKYSYGTAVVRKDDLSGIKTLEDLKGKKAAGASTSIYMEIARSYGAEEVTYDNATNEVYLRDVSIGRTDVILNDYYLSTFGVAAFPELNITIHPDIKYAPSEVGLVMNKDNKELAENVNKALEEMLQDGTISEISAEFFGGADVSVKPDIE